MSAASEPTCAWRAATSWYEVSRTPLNGAATAAATVMTEARASCKMPSLGVFDDTRGNRASYKMLTLSAVDDMRCGKASCKMPALSAFDDTRGGQASYKMPSLSAFAGTRGGRACYKMPRSGRASYKMPRCGRAFRKMLLLSACGDINIANAIYFPEVAALRPGILQNALIRSF